jgi:hypothetical protein
MRCGNIRTHCRTATNGSTSSTRYGARSAVRRPPRDGQNPPPLHENATSWFSPHVAHRNRANQFAKTPHVRNSRNSCSTNRGSPSPSCRATASARNVSKCSRDDPIGCVVNRLPRLGRFCAGELARLLVNADTPVIVAGRAALTPAGIASLVELAELLQAPVNDGPQFTLRMNFPTRHPLKGAGVVANADLILGLELPDFYQLTHRVTPVNRFGMESTPTTKPGAKLVTISASELVTRNNYQDGGRYNEVDLAIPADAEATLPMLVEACRRLITPERRRAMDARGVKLTDASRRLREAALEQAAWGWDARPISTARLSAELWNLVKHEDWSLVSDTSSSATGRSSCGTSRSTISSSAGPAPTASATAHRRRWAPRSRTGSTDASASTFSATAI